MSKPAMRYCCTGEVHLDFHGLTRTTLKYILDHYGMAALEEIFRNTATKVYKTMHEGLRRGDPAELLEFWRYYLEREKGEFTLELAENGAELEIRECPAQRHLKKLGIGCNPEFCLSTTLFNHALCEGTPFTIDTEKTGPASCRQRLRRREEVRR